MGFLKSIQKLTKATVDVALIPAEAVRDVATGEIFEPGDGHTTKRLKRAGKNLKGAYDHLDAE